MEERWGKGKLLMSWWTRIDNLLTPKRLSYSWIAGGAFYLAWLVSILLGPGNMDLANQVVGTDYVQFYAAGKTILERGEADLYDFNVQREIEETVAGQELEGFHAFITPPFVVWLYTPLSILPYSWSYFAFCLFSLALLWLSLRILNKDFSIKSLVWVLTWFPVFANFSFGQNGILSLFILCLTYALSVRRNYFLSGIVFSLMLYKPQLAFGVVFLWILDYRRSWKSLAGFLLGCLGLVGISYLFMPQATQNYLFVIQKILPSIDDWQGFPHWHSYTLRTFFFLISRNSMLTNLLTMALTIFVAIIFIKLWRLERDNLSLMFPAAICLTIFTAPHALVYDWTILLLPAIVYWNQHPQMRRFWKIIFSLVWIAAYVSSVLTMLQLRLLPFAVQISVLALFIVLYYMYRVFAKKDFDPLLFRDLNKVT